MRARAARARQLAPAGRGRARSAPHANGDRRLQTGAPARAAAHADAPPCLRAQARLSAARAIPCSRRLPPHTHPLPSLPQAGDASTVLSLESLAGVEDRELLAGHALLLLGAPGAPDAAEACFLRSGRPRAALEMRRDLKQWAPALALARRLAPEEVAATCRQHAAALEMVGDHGGARAHYEEARAQPLAAGCMPPGVLHSAGAMTAPLHLRTHLARPCRAAQALDAPLSGVCEAEAAEHQRACLGGLARAALRLGEVAEGKAAALQVRTWAVYAERCSLPCHHTWGGA